MRVEDGDIVKGIEFIYDIVLHVKQNDKHPWLSLHREELARALNVPEDKLKVSESKNSNWTDNLWPSLGLASLNLGTFK